MKINNKILFSTPLIIIGLSMNFNNAYFLFLSIPAIQMFFQIKKLNIIDGDMCLKISIWT